MERASHVWERGETKERLNSASSRGTTWMPYIWVEGVTKAGIKKHQTSSESPLELGGLTSYPWDGTGCSGGLNMTPKCFLGRNTFGQPSG